MIINNEKWLRDMAAYYAPTVGQRFLDCADEIAAAEHKLAELREAVRKMLAADGKGNWDAREYMLARAAVDALIGGSTKNG